MTIQECLGLRQAQCMLFHQVLCYHCCCSVAESCLALCNPMDCSISGSPVLHCLLQFAQTHAHGVGDAITLPHPLLSLLLLSSIFPSIRVFCNDLALLIWWPKYWSFSFHISPFNEYSALISFRIDWFDFLRSRCCTRLKARGEGDDRG